MKTFDRYQTVNKFIRDLVKHMIHFDIWHYLYKKSAHPSIDCIINQCSTSRYMLGMMVFVDFAPCCLAVG